MINNSMVEPQISQKRLPRAFSDQKNFMALGQCPRARSAIFPSRVDTSDQPIQKRQRPTSTTAKEAHAETASDDAESKNPIGYWRKHQHWPRTYSDSEDKMGHLLARKKSTSALRRKSSALSISSSSTTPTPSDQKPREAKSAQYRDTRYEKLLKAKNSFCHEYESGAKDGTKALRRELLNTKQNTCCMIRTRNEARLMRDIIPLIVPSAEILAIQTVNEDWSDSIPAITTRPQPDYSVRFRENAFSADRLKFLEPFVGTLWDESYFVATWYMYFPFFTCEVKCGVATLDIADQQNAHSATLAVRAVVELVRLVTYKFTKNVYNNWMPDHFKCICSAIDGLPEGISFDVSQESELQFSSQTGLSQELEGHYLSQSEGSVSVAGQDGGVSIANTNGTTPNTSIPQSFKKPRRRL
ncbi:hypothetical protein K458DRAFT_473279 [Lentithecium fluviatile CBS 122367]|uniref:DUF7924 domain-containing protein n=1 Tax=Lentithecium fluviatile CBS 122367 TaxID=1168545 RepID=A0A6G1JLK1_9PLEO|nr:hypothetical protein K458DRAFT_473279 [Lentithecium fluviatile CBS 122367]